MRVHACRETRPGSHRKDRSVYYSTFPIQEQAQQGYWNYELTAVYTVGILDFVFDDHKHESELLHVVELKNQGVADSGYDSAPLAPQFWGEQNSESWGTHGGFTKTRRSRILTSIQQRQNQHCEVFYDQLKFIYVELPKFTKSVDELESHFDKWLFLFKHLAQLNEPPEPLQEDVFAQLFDVAEIANFSSAEQALYQDSLKVYRDMYNVTQTLIDETLEQRCSFGTGEPVRSWGGSAVLGSQCGLGGSPHEQLAWFPPLALCMADKA